MGNADLFGRRARVLGKGNRNRVLGTAYRHAAACLCARRVLRGRTVSSH
jgi:hypothetical protein